MTKIEIYALLRVCCSKYITRGKCKISIPPDLLVNAKFQVHPVNAKFPFHLEIFKLQAFSKIDYNV